MKGIMLALLVGSVSLASPDANNTAVREGWSGSRELPTAIAYYEFTRLLANVRNKPHAQAHILADAFGMGDVDLLGVDDLRELSAYGDVFLSHFDSMQLEMIETRLRILCSPSVAGLASTKASYAALNAADDVSRPIQEKHLALAMAGLTDEREHAFRTFLDDFKSSVTYMKTDNRRTVASGQLKDPGAELERICVNLQAEYAYVLREGGY